jgi:prefoldin subunit 5
MTTENEYLEMSNHFKQVLDKKEAYINYLQSSLSHVTSDLESINNSITATKMILRMWCCMNSATSETMEKEMNKIQENIKDKMVDITHLDTTFEEFEETYDIAESLHEIQV